MNKELEKECYEEYLVDRIKNNYQRYLKFLLLFIAAGLFFLTRNIYYYIKSETVHANYFYIYLGILITTTGFRFFLPVFYRKKRYATVNNMITAVSIILFFLMINLALLDSFDYESYDYSAYIFGSLMLGFLFRTDRNINLIVHIGGMLYFILMYYFLRPDIFRFAAFLPLFALTIFAFFFSCSKENMNHKLFRASYELEKSNQKLRDLSFT